MHEVLMEASSLSAMLNSIGPVALAVVLAVVGSSWLLPRPRGRFVAGGVTAWIAAGVILAVWLYERWGRPASDAVGSLLFALFALSALLGGATLVVQRNPARGAIAFAFSILGVCGLFLLLAAPFLMAVTLIVYAGAIIVTFLFVLMLSRTAGPSDENDRSREPLLGSLAGFAFAGLVLWLLHLSTPADGSAVAMAAQEWKTEGGGRMTQGDEGRLGNGKESRSEGTAPGLTALRAHKELLTVLTNAERQKLREALRRLDQAGDVLAGDLRQNREKRIEYFEAVKDLVVQVVGAAREDEMGAAREGSLSERLVLPVHATGVSMPLYRSDPQVRGVIAQARRVRAANWEAFKQIEGQLLSERPERMILEREIQALRQELVLLLGSGEMPARTVSNLAYVMYSEYLLAVEAIGVLLLIATVGAVAVAQRYKGAGG
jgi:NADH:ubiquinone oxidoreductase subunit 6 (subunit J)